MVNDDRGKGLYPKVEVRRLDGSSRPGGKHADCEWFALDMTHDPYAVPALLAYAEACVDRYPKLAVDLARKVLEFRLPWGLVGGEFRDVECRALKLINDMAGVEAPPF